MTHDQMARLAARLRDKSARFRKHADFLLNSVPGDPINNAAAKGLTADSDDLNRAADLIEKMAQPEPIATVYYPRTEGTSECRGGPYRRLERCHRKGPNSTSHRQRESR